MFCLLLRIALSPALAADAPARGMLYKLEYAGHTSWLFGTIHVGSPDFYPLEARVSQALEKATALALEIDPAADPAKTMAVMREHALYAPGAGPAMAEIRPPYRPRLERMLRAQGIAPEMVAPMKPWMIAMVLTLGAYKDLGYRPELGVDLTLARAAHGRQLPVVELESAGGQAALFSRLSPAEQVRFLEDGIDALENPDIGVQPRELMEAWASADKAKFAALAKMVEEDQTFSGKFMKKILLDERNPVLADGILAMMKKEQDSFAAIGLLHLVGSKGSVPELLRQRGVKVEQIY